jgi:4a-hydroxytetrahydrobiopterin dehydratase
MAHLLDDEERTRALEGLPGWEGDSAALRRTVSAPDFPTAVRLVGAVAEVAEELDHHPDIDIRWRTLTFVLSTHSAGGVTQNDVELAHRIAELAARFDAT